ncbi:MAG: glycosyltransferase family 2 protein [Gammaproteobacteria bacterium]
MNKLVSIIIPAYNCADLVGETIDNVLEQSYPHKELIVVNDGSTDRTREVLEAYGDRIRLIDQPNSGAPAARNTGLLAAQGDYICLIDADDLWMPGKLDAQVRHLEQNPEVGMVYHDWFVWEAGPDGSFQVPPASQFPDTGDAIDPEKSGWIYPQLLLDCVVHTSTIMVRREIREQVGLFDDTIRNGDDYDYWLRVSRITRIDKLKKVYSLYRILPGSIARTPHDINHEYVVLSNALDNWGATGPDGRSVPRRLLRQRKAKILFDYGYSHYHGGNARHAVRAFGLCVLQTPLRASPWLYLARSVLRAV